MLGFITWETDPILVDLGFIALRYYSLLFVVAFLIGLEVIRRMFKSENLNQAWADKLFIYVGVGVFVGARLGHCLFYDWDYYSHHLLEIVLPVKFDPFRFIGYQGLASHGAAIGILIAMYLYSKRISKRPMLWILDRAVIPVALSGVFIRLGNLMNSEIVGAPTDVDWGFIFVRNGEDFARHPAQLYEAVCYLFTFASLMHLYWRTKAKEHLGLIFGVGVVMIFTFRFFIEFVKEVQESWEQSMALDMGQWLSLPFIVAGLCVMWYSRTHLFKEKKK